MFETEDTIQHIPLVDILFDEEFNCRGVIAPIDVTDLAQDIDKNGMIQPVTVMRFDEENQKKYGKKYKLIAGYRRFTAHILLKKDTIKSVIIDSQLNEMDARILNLSENLKRKDLNIIQEAKAIKRLKELGIGEFAVAEKLGTSRGWVQIRFMLLQLPPEIQEEAATNMISQTHIRELYTIFKNFGKEAAFGAVRKIKDAKIKGVSLSVNVNKLNAKSKHHRKRPELFFMIDHIMESLGAGLPTRCLAWAAGEINDEELFEDIAKEAADMNIPYTKPERIFNIPKVEDFKEE